MTKRRKEVEGVENICTKVYDITEDGKNCVVNRFVR